METLRLLVGVENGAGAGKTVWRFLDQSQMESPRPPAPLQGTYPTAWKAGAQTKTCTQMTIAALLTVAKRWKQLRCPQTDAWINKHGRFTRWNITQP